jgi:hypothetical protein
VEHGDTPNGRRKRLVQALLAFPLAALIGFGASMMVRTLRVEAPRTASPSTRSPRPAGVELERRAPAQRTERGTSAFTAAQRRG